jgi:general secretion pathway protein D
MRRFALVVAAATVAACASSGAYHAGRRAEAREDYNRAVLEFARAVKKDPNNLTYRKSLERARLRASEAHAIEARRLAARGLLKEALDEMRLAADLRPDSSALAEELHALEARRGQADTGAAIAAIKERARESLLPGLDLDEAARAPISLRFPNASLKDTYMALGKAVGVNFVFDPQFQDTTIENFEVHDVPFEQALKALATYGRTFHVVADSKVITVVPDTASKRREYEQQVVKTLFVSNADLREVIDVLRIVLGSRRIAPMPTQNAITINDTPDKVMAAERIVDILDKKRAEVVVEVELLEVNRSRLDDYGIELTTNAKDGGGITGLIFPSPVKLPSIPKEGQGAISGVTPPITLKDNPYEPGNLLVSNLPGVIYRLLKTDSSTRLLANPRLRTSEGQTAQARFGDKIPVPITTFTPIATGGINQQPFTSFDYKDVGVNIDITPRVHHDGEVSLGLKLDISSLATSIGLAGVQGVPTFNSRTVTSQIRLKDGETSVLAGLISDNERKSLSGIPGLASLPVVGQLFARNKREITQTDIILTLTPRIVMRPEITLEDLRSFHLASETPPLLFEVPAIPPVSGVGSTATPKPTEAPKVEPIRPPTPVPATPTPAER